jgi:hypothetical protein
LERQNRAPVRVVSAVSKPETMQVNVVSDDVQRAEIAIELRASSITDGGSEFRGSIIIETDGQECNRIEVPVVATIDRRNGRFVESILLEGLGAGASLDQLILVSDSRSAQIDVERISFSGDSWIDAALVRGSDGVPRVRFSRDEQDSDGRLVRGTLRVHLKGRRRTVDIPVTVVCIDSR